MSERESMDSANRKREKSWFENNPGKIVFIMLLVIFLGMIFLTEKILAAKLKIHDSGVKRYIMLREYPALYSDSVRVGQLDYVYDKDVNIELHKVIRKDYLKRTDKNGFIMPSEIHDKPDVTIVFLGGSTTECEYIDEEKRFPYLAGRFIERETGLKVNSYNSGVAGNNSLHSIDILLNKIIPMKPNIVVMMHNINDLIVLLHEKSYWCRSNMSKAPIVEIKRVTVFEILKRIKDLTIPNLYRAVTVFIRSKIFRTKNDEFRHTRGERITIDKPYFVNEFKMNLQTFIDICKNRGITPVLMTQPNRLKRDPDVLIRNMLKPVIGEGNITYEAFKEIFDDFNQVIKEVGRENDVLVIDLAARGPPGQEYIYDSVHLSDKGAEFVSGVISKELKTIAPFVAKE